MEELNNRLNSGNPIVVAQVITKLVNNIKSKQKKENGELPELAFLKEKCTGNSHAISVIASKAILNIVQNENFVTAEDVIADFTTIITTTKCSCSNITFLLNNLLLIDLNNKLSQNKNYKCHFNLQLPQHPFIIMLNEDSNSWFSVFNEISYTYNNVDSSNVYHYTQLYKPVFLYILCNPHENNLISFKQKLWTFLIHNDNIMKHANVLNCLLSWMQFERRENIHLNLECKNVIITNSNLLMELSDVNQITNYIDHNLLLLWQTSALYQLISNDFDPRTMILSIQNMLSKHTDEPILSCVLLIIAKSIPVCPSVYMRNLLHLYKSTITQTNCHPITAQIIKYSLLEWIANPSALTAEALTTANQILSLVQTTSKKISSKNHHTKFFKQFEKLINTNNDVYMAVQLFILLETWKTPEDILNWLEMLRNAPTFFVLKTVDFLFGLFLCEFSESKISLLAFELILKCVNSHKILAPNVLTVILHRLTNTTDSDLHFQLLKAIPKMAIIKDNIQKIVNTIQALNKGPASLKTFSTTLMLDLWKIDNKCYPYLENFLIAPCTAQCNKWEFYVTRAYVLKELCALKPELYGKEMVAHLSKILNECNNADGAVACALAIEGISLLCKFEIIDAVTTWATLAPMFKEEARVPVIKSLCLLISEMPSLSYTEAYPNLIDEVVTKLWDFTVYNKDNEVWEAALDALTHFNVDQIVAQMPEEYCDEETLTIKKSGHVVPGQCWIHFLKTCDSNKLEVVGNFLIKMVTLEITSYLKFVYQVKGTREPVDYSFLPVNSVVRGISTYIKSKMLKWQGSLYNKVYLQCLRIFSQEYSKPLPPLDWCFLQELVHEQEAKKYCINIASHQVILSGTARRLIVNYIEALTENYNNEDDVLSIYSNLKYLANSVQPFTLKPFLEITICNAVELYKNEHKELFFDILKQLQATLEDKTVQEANKSVIAEIIISMFNETEISSEVFDHLLQCVIRFPVKHIEELSSPKLVQEIRSDWLKKAVKIRCTLALTTKETPLNWLNDLMEVGNCCPNVTAFIFEEFNQVFQKHKDNIECVLWMLELIGQIQALTAEKAVEEKILLYCNVFILATLVFSGHYVLLKDISDCEQMYKLFPRAITTLLEMNHWSICTNQVLEWFYHMNTSTEKIFYKEYKDMFLQCLQALRNDDEFHKYMKWTKYLNVELLYHYKD